LPERDFHPLELSTLLGRTPLWFDPFGFGIDYKTEQEFAHIMIFFEKIGFLEAKDNCVKVSTETVIH